MHHEVCPHCGYEWESLPCCDKPSHNRYAVCPRCRRLNIAFTPWTEETIKRQRLEQEVHRA